MKKITLSLILVSFLAFSVVAQEEEKSYDATGQYALDINFNPAAIFDAGAGAMFSMPFVKLRIFQSDVSAFRLGFNLGFNTDKNLIDPNSDDYTKSSSFMLNIAPGIERHMGSGRVRPYYGAALPIGLRSTSSETKFGDTTTEQKNPNGGHFSVGLSAIMGVVYYCKGGFYLGAELTPGLNFVKQSEQKNGDTITDKGGSSFNFGLSSSSGVIVGIRF